MFFPAPVPSRSLGALAWWQHELLTWSSEISRCSEASMCHLVQCVHFHMVVPARAVPEQHPSPKAMIVLVAPAWIWSSSAQGLHCWVAQQVAPELQWIRQPPFPSLCAPLKAHVCLTVLLPHWVWCNCYHVPLQQWSWLAWHFPRKS